MDLLNVHKYILFIFFFFFLTKYLLIFYRFHGNNKKLLEKKLNYHLHKTYRVFGGNKVIPHLKKMTKKRKSMLCELCRMKQLVRIDRVSYRVELVNSYTRQCADVVGRPALPVHLLSFFRIICF